MMTALYPHPALLAPFGRSVRTGAERLETAKVPNNISTHGWNGNPVSNEQFPYEISILPSREFNHMWARL
ncbi:MAG: hypothetical protein A07HR60_02314 [uncultured archaeon A07HR60]|nr:MAG: hypothetical protein A07HR60_02314 [uncultured archaeon A07HR60]